MFNYKRRIVFPLLFASLLLCASMAWLFHAMYQLIEFSEKKDTLDRQRYNIVALGKAITDAESGQRGYLLTGNTQFLDTFQAGKSRTLRELTQLHDQVEQFPEIHGVIEDIKSLIHEKFDVMDRNIQVQLHAGSFSSHLSLSKDKGREVMGKINADIAMADNALAKLRLDYEDEIKQRILEAILGAVVLGLLIIGILVFSYRRTTHLFEQIIENKSIAEQLSYQATHDLLTGLPNRRSFDHQLNTIHAIAQRTPKKMAVFFMDLDGFKQVNDSYGHEIGDLLLIRVADIFTRILRQYDFLARIGGDEFVLLVEYYEKEVELIQLAGRLIQSLRSPIQIEPYEVTVGVSIGIAEFPQDGTQVDQLLHAADHAMYVAKKQGKNRYCFAHKSAKGALLTSPTAPLEAIS